MDSADNNSEPDNSSDDDVQFIECITADDERSLYQQTKPIIVPGSVRSMAPNIQKSRPDTNMCDAQQPTENIQDFPSESGIPSEGKYSGESSKLPMSNADIINSLEPPVQDQPRFPRNFMINAGRDIPCLLCGEQFRETFLLKHIAEAHFEYYRPYRCGQCNYWVADRSILLNVHQFETGHVDGALNCHLYGIKDENVEFVIKVLYSHCLEAHVYRDNGMNSILVRLRAATETLRGRRRPQMAQDASRDETNENEINDQATVPLPSPAAIDVPPQQQMVIEEPVACESLLATSSTIETTKEPSQKMRMPVPVPGPSPVYKARKTIARVWSTSSNESSLKTNSPGPHYNQGSVMASPGTNSHALLTSSLADQQLNVNANASNDQTGSSPELPTLKQCKDSRCQDDSASDKLGGFMVSSTSDDESDDSSFSSNGGTGTVEAETRPVSSLPSMLVCDFCGKACFNVCHLKEHCKQNHLAGYAPFRCLAHPNCRFTSWRQLELRQHLSGDNIAIQTTPAPPDEAQRGQLVNVYNSLMAKGIACQEFKKMFDG